jgi:DNA-binding winged helix-turn-helix (wHTH) protein/Tfp pilus assembly protein PilF
MPTRPVLRFVGFEFDEQRAELRGPRRQVIPLRPKAFAMLRLLVANADRVISKEELMQTIWPNTFVTEDSLFQCVHEVRAALGDERRQIIKAVSGRGYLFNAEVSNGAARPVPIAKAVRPTFVLDIGEANNDPRAKAMAADVTNDLTNGLAKISNIRVLTPVALNGSASPTAPLDFKVDGKLLKDGNTWSLQARMFNTSDGEVGWSTAISVDANDADLIVQRCRLVGGLGYELAHEINALIHPREPSAKTEATAHAHIVVEQAAALINHTSLDRFAAAQVMLERALAAQPDNIELKAALAAHLLRGVQSVWYPAADSEAAVDQARLLLESVLQAHPDYLPALEGYCRLLTATNELTASLVACANALTLNPWDGTVRFNLGLAQCQLGRFAEALATFEAADRFETPRVSRWTWPLGAGIACLHLKRDEEAVPWLQKSLAITPGTGRTHLLLAAAYQRLGRLSDAKQALADGLALRPGSTAENFPLSYKNASPSYIEASKQVKQTLVALGLPEY